MNIRNLFAVCAWSALAALPSASQAHFLWATLDPQSRTVAVGLQEVPGTEPLPLGARAARVRAWLPLNRPVSLKADGNWLRGDAKGGSVGVGLDYGVIDRRDGGRGVFWLKYYAKAAATVGASQSELDLPVELSAVVAGDGKTRVTVRKDGKPAAGADVVVEDADGKTAFEGKTDAEGAAVLPPATGPLQVRALVTESTPGSHEGKHYDLIRSYGTLTVQNPAAEPLSRQFRESFGEMHDVVSNTAFIDTVMAGSLTKPQLEAHLQQRALIHEAVDEILAKPFAGPLPYGDPQRRVLTLLRADLRAMGASWPSADKAWPLTRKLLAEIRESAKRGPYFALGVFHVYYGGITHGGRDIGDMIGSQLKVDLTYYEKSDGYDAYAQGVDEITDPKAQAEAVRGGNEAYRYIIAVNDEDAFKAKTKS